MKHGFLRLPIIILALSGAVVYANDTASLIFKQKPGYTISLTGLYLRPSASNLDYAVFTNPLPLAAPNWQQRVVDPGFSAAFDLGLQYNLANDRENLKLDWLHFNSNDSDSAGSTPNTSVGPVFYYGPAEQFLLNTSASSTVKFDIDHGSLVFSHLVDLNNNIQVEPFIGVNAVYLQEKISNNYLGRDPVYGPYTHAVYTKSTFTGFGPRIGLNGSYFLTNHFAITASLAGDLLAGDLKYSTDFTSWTGYTGDATHNNIPANTSMANDTIQRIVPEVDTKIALLYKVSFDNSNSELTIQAGYMYAVYFNAIHEVLPSTLVPGSWEAGSVAIINQTQQQSNVDLRGPFVNVAWKF